MKIVIADIPDDGLIFDIHERLSLPEVAFFSPVTAHLEVNRMENEITVSGSLGAELGLQCSRCLKDLRRHMEIPVSVVYHAIGELGLERHELKDDEMDMDFYTGDEIDLQELLREQIVINLQMKPLCSDDCRGICPGCGTDLNAGQCTCSGTQIDPRLEVLKNYLEKRKE